MEFAGPSTRLKSEELEKQLVEKRTKLEQVHEQNAEYLRQVNTLLQEKFNEHCRCEQLQSQNTALAAQVKELQETCQRLQLNAKEIQTVKPVLVDNATQTVIIEVPIPTPVMEVQLYAPPQSLPPDVCARLWNLESKILPNCQLLQFYEIQRDFLLIMVGLQLEEWLTHAQFESLWYFSGRYHEENLLVEILARKHLRLLDPFSAFIMIGDVGARVFLYYADWEEQLHLRRSAVRHIDDRHVDWTDYGAQLAQQFYGQTNTTILIWKTNLESLLPLVRHEVFLTRILKYNLQRTYHTTSDGEFTTSHYVYNRDRALDRVQRYLVVVEAKGPPMLSLQGQVQFLSSPPGYVPKFLTTADVPVGGTVANQRYLGQYPELFDGKEEEPVPTWSALAWILEDYGLSRTESMAADLIYKQVSGTWSYKAPLAVQVHPQYCRCPRRDKWSPDATLNSVEYNWPQISGSPGFNTPEECRDAYSKFFHAHRYHKDPVCFRAAIFCAVLADWCARWNITINVNVFHESRHEFWMLLKLQYRPTHWIRVVEAMAITHFIEGVHTSLINEFPYTRASPFERFYRWQNTHNPEGVARDEDLSRAIARLEAREAKQRYILRSPTSFSEDREDGPANAAKRKRIGGGANS